MINLHSKFAPHLPKIFSKGSLIAGRLSENYTFKGVATVEIMIPQTVPLNNYKRSGTNRYGEPQEIQDTKQELTLRRDRSFSMTVDKGNNTEQGQLKSAAKMIRLEIQQRCIPESDAYTFNELAQNGGTIVGISEKLTKDNIADYVSDGTAELDDHEVPEDNRTLYLTPAGYKLLKHSPLFVGNSELAKKPVLKGQIGEYDNMPAIKVSSRRWPANVLFMIVHKDAACAPETINETKLHQDPPGISGNLMEGRFRYDCFVFEPTACGIYVAVDTSSGKGTVCALPTIAEATGVITAASGCTVKYTTDGSDPRYSASAVVGKTPTAVTGTLVKAYQYKEGAYASGVAEMTVKTA